MSARSAAPSVATSLHRLILSRTAASLATKESAVATRPRLLESRVCLLTPLRPATHEIGRRGSGSAPPPERVPSGRHRQPPYEERQATERRSRLASACSRRNCRRRRRPAAASSTARHARHADSRARSQHQSARARDLDVAAAATPATARRAQYAATGRSSSCAAAPPPPARRPATRESRRRADASRSPWQHSRRGSVRRARWSIASSPASLVTAAAGHRPLRHDEQRACKRVQQEELLSLRLERLAAATAAVARKNAKCTLACAARRAHAR